MNFLQNTIGALAGTVTSAFFPVTADHKLSEALQNKEQIPSGNFIEYAFINFGIGNSKEISEEVKWQIYHAAYASKDVFGVVHIGTKFSIDHLNFTDLVILYRILNGYYNNEKHFFGEEHAKFGAHVKLIEERLVKESWSNYQSGQELVSKCKVLQVAFCDYNLLGIIAKLEGVIACASQYPIPTSYVDAKVNEAKSQAAYLPSGALIWFAVNVFNLGNDPKYPLLSDEIKWLIISAAKSFKDENYQIHLVDFTIDHLSPKDLATLTNILNAYYAYEIGIKGISGAIFNQHLTVLEKRMEQLCWANFRQGKELLQHLKKIENPSLQQVINHVESIIKLIEQTPSHMQLVDCNVSQALSSRSPALDLKSNVQNDIDKARTRSGILSSGSLIQHADAFFNLTNDPRLPILSDGVKLQILNATGSYKDKQGAIHLGDNFTVEHLTIEELVTLYVIFQSYYATEKTLKGEANAIFHRHLFFIESRFENICWSNTAMGQRTIEVIRTNNLLAADLTARLQTILDNKAKYPTFKEDEVITDVLARVGAGEISDFFYIPGRVNNFYKWLIPGQTRKFFASKGLEETQEFMMRLQGNYKNFLQWLDAFSEIENKESDPVLKKAALRWKSEIEHTLYERYTSFITNIASDYPELFENKFAIHNLLAIKPDGMKLIIDKFKEKGAVKDNVIFCENFEEFRAELKKVENGPNGVWYYSLRWYPGVHQAGGFIEKMGPVIVFHVMDSTQIDADLNTYNFYMVENVQKALPKAKIFTYKTVRQRDTLNCGTMLACDIKTMSKNQWPIVSWIRGNAKPGLTLIPNLPQHVKDVQIVEDLPLVMLNTAQSLSQVEKAVQSPKGPVSVAEIEKFQKRIRKYRTIEMAKDSVICSKPIYAYTKLKGMKYRLEIIARTFQTLPTLT